MDTCPNPAGGSKVSTESLTLCGHVIPSFSSPASIPAPPSLVGTRESGSGHTPCTKEGITRHSSSDSRLLTPGKIASGPTHHFTDALGPGLHSEPPTLTAHTHSSPSLTAASTGVKLIPPSHPSPPVTSSLLHRLTQATPPGDLTITSLLSSAGRSDALPNWSTTGYGRYSYKGRPRC